MRNLKVCKNTFLENFEPKILVSGEEYEILKTVNNTVIKKSLENDEEPH